LADVQRDEGLHRRHDAVVVRAQPLDERLGRARRDGRDAVVAHLAVVDDHDRRRRRLALSETRVAPGGWDVIGTRLKTVYSNNIRNNFGFLNNAAPEGIGAPDKLFIQQGRKVFKDVVPMVSDMIMEHAGDLGLDPHGLKRMWLHQANINMNQFIGRKVLGREPTPDENVIVLDEYANTSSAGSIIAFHLRQQDMSAGDTGLICSFGAGYSAGTVFVRKR
jgi:beta-ketodecanoyl-[acyl-carrier-protein] synthase